MKKNRIDKTAPENRSLALLLSISAGVVLFLALASICVGRFNKLTPAQSLGVFVSQVLGVHTGEWTGAMISVVMQLRLPRMAAAVLVGGSLALSGAAYQGVFKNPLVSPDLLGVSAGACLGASVAILFDMHAALIQLFAFAGGISAVVMTGLIPRLLRRSGAIILVLSGIIASALFNSVFGLIKYMADPNSTKLQEIVFWTMGSLADMKVNTVLTAMPVMLIAGTTLIAMRWRVNLLSLGDKEAKALGVNIKTERIVIIAASTILTACAVCMSGTIGWIGLVTPHMARHIAGPDNARVLPFSVLISAAFMLVIDMLARTLTGGEIPLGIITGIIGAPFFALTLVREGGADLY